MRESCKGGTGNRRGGGRIEGEAELGEDKEFELTEGRGEEAEKVRLLEALWEHGEAGSSAR